MLEEVRNLLVYVTLMLTNCNVQNTARVQPDLGGSVCTLPIRDAAGIAFVFRKLRLTCWHAVIIENGALHSAH